MTDIKASDIGLKGAALAPDTPKTSDLVTKWLKEISEAAKLEKDFRKEGHKIVELYECEKKVEYQFNILFSNTETMLPALYNSTPRPLVDRRFKDEDPLGKMASKVAQRTLEYLIDDGNPNYASFDDLMKSAVLEALLPGRGVTRFKYDATFEKVANEQAADVAEEATSESPDEGESASEATEEVAEGVEPPEERVKYETVCGEEVPWDRFLHGQAKKWKAVPWVLFEHFMVREELEKNFGAIGAKVPVIEMVKEADEDSNIEKRDDLKTLKVAQVYEIWDKSTKKVVFISPQWKEGPLKLVDDPLGLVGFFPCPKPISFVAKVSTLIPVALYTTYEEQAKELNRVTVRINKLIGALKVRGLYDSTVEGIDKVLAADDNTLVPAENVAAMLANGNALEKAIWLMPLNELTQVLQQLYLQREQVKTTIYELTGIADIMRGSSQASETLGAQQIKNQWGTLRLKKTQKEVQRYARDCLRLMAEIAVSKLSPQTLKGMTGLPYPTEPEKQQAQQMLAMQQQQAQVMAEQAQVTGQQPPPPQPADPKVQEAASLPSWEQLLGLLQDDIQRNYRIDIETNSTVDAEATEDKEDLGELMNAISQFINGIGPLIANGTMPFEVAQGMLLEVVRRYRFGSDMEDAIKKMQPPQQGGPKPEELKKQQDELAAQGEQLAQQKKQVEEAVAKLQLDQQAAQNELELERKQFEMEKVFAQREAEMNKQFTLREMALEAKVLDEEHNLKVSAREAKLNAKQAAFDAKRTAKETPAN